MSEAPQLLTVAMAEALGGMSPEARVRMLRERGLIAPEPVDPLLFEAASKLVHDWVNGSGGLMVNADFALAALRRGMELAKPELTLERVREALLSVCPFPNVDPSRLHAALTGGDA